MFGIGKGTVFKKLISCKQFLDISQTFTTFNTPKEDIEVAGEKAMLILYNGGRETDINSRRHKILIKTVTAAQSFVQPQRLPPTKASTKYHSYRTYLQIMQWKGYSITVDDWGWFQKSGKYIPLTTDLAAAPSSLLKVIRCMCKMDCSTNICGCRKNKLHCTYACGPCQNDNCCNIDMVKRVGENE